MRRRCCKVMDVEPLVSSELMVLAEWVAAYYVAPIGEVLRAMLPLTNEVRRENHYRITEQGQKVLQQGADVGASRRSRLTAEAQQQEYAVLNALAQEETMSARSLSSSAGAKRPLLDGMVRKKWIVREQQATARAEGRKQKIAVVVESCAAAEVECVAAGGAGGVGGGGRAIAGGGVAGARAVGGEPSDAGEARRGGCWRSWSRCSI